MRKLIVALSCALTVAFAPSAQAQVVPVAAPSVAGSTVAKIIVPTVARKTPGGKSIMTLKTQTKFSGGAAQYLVLSSKVVNDVQWIQVRLPIRPNGTTGWIVADDTLMHKNAYRVLVDVSSRTVDVFKGARKVKHFRAVVGKPSTPTPIGEFAIQESVAGNPGSFTGSQILVLTAFSNVLQQFAGSNGQVGIHGRGGASLNDPLGSARSHGCVRMDNSAVNYMAGVLENGTPVTIRR